MYLTPTNQHWACDIEANGYRDSVTEVWCICLTNCITKEEIDCVTKEQFHEFERVHPDAIYVGHNFIAYDAPVTNRLWASRIRVGRIVDTFILSQLYNPSYSGGHSLRKWGERLGYLKSSNEDFSQFSPEMLKYCRRDTRLTALLFLRLSERMVETGFTEEGCQIEHQAWHLIQNKQKENGFPFDRQRAQELYVTLRAREEELKNEIYKLWPPLLQCVHERSQARKKDGAYTKQYESDLGKFPKLEEKPDGTYRVYDYVAFNIGSPPQRIEKLLGLGWKPTSFTPRTDKGGGGNPKVDEDSLLDFAESSGNPEIVAIAKWVVVNARANMLGNWLEAYNEKTGAIHGTLFLASTLRYRHSNPNSANIPAVRSRKVDGEDQILYGEEGAWTYEVRDLWTSGGDDFTLVGIDGKGMQLRCLAHNVAKIVGPEADAFIADVLEGDPHKKNIVNLGLANKPAAKKFLYTTLMGGGGAKLAVDQAQFGTILTSAEGEELKKKLISSVPGFNELIRELQSELRRTGRITLCDGSRVIVSSPHMVIPYLLQGDESRLMKKALIYVDQEVSRQRLQGHVFKVADIHDEWQFRVRNKYVNQFISLALPCFPRAGNSFKYLIQIDGDAKAGKTWAETH